MRHLELIVGICLIVGSIVATGIVMKSIPSQTEIRSILERK